ncbi:MAG: hypothetical protein IJN96_07545 [Clostridia bacterium]|nr:hypothetical protein [Clostridia bacterium]
MFCANCGKQIKYTDIVCKKCGNEVELNGYMPFFDNEEPADAVEVDESPVMVNPEPVVTVTSERAVGFGTIEESDSEEDAFWSGRWFIVTVIVSVCLVIGAVAAIVLFSNSMAAYVEAPEQAQTETAQDGEKQSDSNGNQGIIVEQ